MKLWKVMSITVSILITIVIAFGIAFACVRGSIEEVSPDYLGEDDLAKSAKVTASDSSLGAKKATDNSLSSYWEGHRRDSYIQFDFGKEIVFDTVTINEIGYNITEFEIQVAFSIDENNEPKFSTIYRQDHVEMHRLCALKDPVTARYMRIVVSDSTASPKISNITVHNKAAQSVDNFQVVGYMIINGLMEKYHEAIKSGDANDSAKVYDIFDGDKFDVYNVINLISSVGWNDDADIYFSPTIKELNIGTQEEIQATYKDLFEKTLAALRSVIGSRNVRINVTMINPRDNALCVKSMVGKNKTKLAKNMSQFIAEHGLDGIDIDWEYPLSQVDFDAYNAFLQELKATMHDGAELSLAVSTWAFKYTPETIKVIDRIQLMGYDIIDQNGDHGGFYAGAVQAVEYCLSKGFSLNQINLGMGLYGTHREGKMEQYNINSVKDYDWMLNKYTVSTALGDVDDVYFNGGQMLYDKTTFAIYKGLGGIMTWQMYSDKKGLGENTLIYGINKALVERAGGVL